MTKPTFEQVTRHAKGTGAKWSAKDIALFNYFNPNGAMAAKRISDEAISQAVTDGLMAGGSIIAYGGFNNFNSDRLLKLIDQKRPDRFAVNSAVAGLLHDTFKAFQSIEAAKQAATLMASTN